MFGQYEKLTVISNLMNSFFQENQVPVLSWVSGNAIYQKGESEYLNSFFDYISKIEFYTDIKKSAHQHKVPLNLLIQEFLKKVKIEDQSTDKKSFIKKYLDNLIFIDLSAPANNTQKQIIKIANFINIQLFQTGYKMVAEIDSAQLNNSQLEDSCIKDFFNLQYWEQFQSILQTKTDENKVPKEYIERNMYKNISQFIPFPIAIQIKNNYSSFLLKNANYLAYSLSKVLMEKGAHCIVTVNKAKLINLSYDEITLYQTITAVSWNEILLEAKKKGMTYGLYLQTFFDARKNTVFESFLIVYNFFGMAAYDLDCMKKDYDIINQILHAVSSNPNPVVKTEEPHLDTKTVINSSAPDAQDLKQYFDDRFQKLFSKLDNINDTVLEGTVSVLDEFEDVHAKIDQSQENILSCMQNFDEKMEQLIKEGNQKDLCEIFEEKIAVIKNLNQKSFPKIQLKEHIVFILAFLRHPDGIQAIQHFLEDIEEENYKKDYQNKIKEGNVSIYTSENDLGEYMVCKKDSAIILLQLSLKKQYVFDSAVAFFASCKQTLKPSIYFDDAIFEKFTELIQHAKQSIYIICPWVNEYALQFYEKDLEAAKNRNVRIFIKYGYLSEGSNLEKNQENRNNFAFAQEQLLSFRKKLGGALFMNDDDTHIKAVIIDGKISLLGSCNLLSFHYNYKRNPDFRHELMMLVEEEEVASALIKYCEGNIYDVK